MMLDIQSFFVLKPVENEEYLKKHQPDIWPKFEKIFDTACVQTFIFIYNDSFCIYFGIEVGMCLLISSRRSFHWINFNQKLVDAKVGILNIKFFMRTGWGSFFAYFSHSVLNFTKTCFYINIDNFLKQYLVPLILRLEFSLNIFLFSYVLSISVL